MIKTLTSILVNTLMTFYNRDSEGDYTRAPDTEHSRVDKIEPGIYELRVPMMGAPYLHRIADRKPLPAKLYGDAQSLSNRIFHTYMDRRENGLNTGILLEGIKGSGKSLTSSISINKVIDAGGYCITINKPYPGQLLKDIIGTPTQPVVLDFDEFEKIYKPESSTEEAIQRLGLDRNTLSELLKRSGTSSASNPAQESLLTFLSGGTTSGVLSLITVNDSSNINQFMRRRPSRIFYNVKYNGLPSSVIEAFSQDALDDKTLVAEFARKASRIKDVSFDILTSLVEDINRMKLGVNNSMEIMGFGMEAQEEFRRLIIFRGVDVTALYDGTSGFTPSAGDYPHDMDSTDARRIFAYREALDDPEVDKKHLNSLALMARSSLFGVSIDDEDLFALPTSFRSSSDVFGAGKELMQDVYLLPTEVSSVVSGFDTEAAQNDLVVVAVNIAVPQLHLYQIVRALGASSKAPEAPSEDTSLSFGTRADNILARAEMTDMAAQLEKPVMPQLVQQTVAVVPTQPVAADEVN